MSETITRDTIESTRDALHAILRIKAPHDKDTRTQAQKLIATLGDENVKITIARKGISMLSEKGHTFSTSAAWGDHTYIIPALRASGFDLNECDRFGSTAAVIAARKDNGLALKALFKAGADLNKQDGTDWRALDLAGRHGCFHAAKTLKGLLPPTRTQQIQTAQQTCCAP